MTADYKGPWPRKPLGEVAAVGSGYAFKSSEFRERGIPAIKIKNVRVGHVDLSAAECVDEKYLSLAERYHVRPGDVLISLTGSHMSQPNSVVGRVARHSADHPECLLNQRVGKVIIRDSSKSDLCFLYYALSEQDAVRAIAMKAHGAANQANVSPAQVESVEIPLPPQPVQQRIAGILSAYDDLIETNQRRIKILESMARTLYCEWFVHFRFPGQEYHPRVPSPLGDIPKGWQVKRVGDVFQTVLGGTPSRARPEFWEGGTVPWINSGKVNDLRITEASEFITALALEKSAAKVMPVGTTVLAITGATLGQVSYLEIETTANQSVVGIVDPTELRSEWIYLTVRERIEGIIKHASGGAQQHINKEIVNDVLVGLPPASLAKDFKQVVAPMFREVATLLFQIQNLRRTRDLLLPRLVSGQIDVEAIAS